MIAGIDLGTSAVKNLILSYHKSPGKKSPCIRSPAAGQKEKDRLRGMARCGMISGNAKSRRGAET